jgi:hypothetical protein
MGNTISGWVELGADQEDVSTRPRNHFYNPLNGQGLTYWLITGLPSPRWGLEDTGGIGGQDYSIEDARDYFYAGLALPTKSERNAALAKTLRTLGQVIHLVQDAGQPQHTRNDAHILESGLGSGYEAHADEKRKASALVYDGYPTPVFNYAYQYWYTASGGGNGLAEYSNRNFVSSGTNFQTMTGGVPCPTPIVPGFPAPALNPTTERIEDIATVASTLQEPVSNLKGKMLFFSNPINDTYNSKLSGTNYYQTSHSIFHHALKSYYPNTCYYAFELNRFTHAAAEQFLIPRAVAYSAGLLDHFFRGGLDVTKLSVANGQLEVTVKNVSTTGNDFVNGNFELWYESTDGTLKPMQLLNNSGMVGSAGMAVGRTRAITATYPADLSCREKYFRVVYRGTIGKEEGIAGKAFNEEFLITTKWVIDFKRCEYSFDGTKSCLCNDGVGVVFDGGPGGATYSYSMSVFSYSLLPNPDNCPIKYNYFKDISWYYMHTQVVNWANGTWTSDYQFNPEYIHLNIHPYSNADSDTLTVSGSPITASYTNSFVARKVRSYGNSTGYYRCE